ncbi:nicotinate-nucleotide--dimethylbenzimidazole phosphoribosyltransferase [Seleniivibrio woodruffii]|uniref:Nicotinate-nucleotide--dimethylbenzimidazole phosphoribosyltransferase n=1 Tax=Seleniivibrio woodruffii TaxID=1078050 RepID=A0A4R1K9L1_9BACT|nr:nicotinate-nucleotide--dimethylbenzimidazole phosphoribosyltransferase [Seleniivibrio woodruffii]TCK61044.1 nicotinate-nucleotide-dimethylbenzimidazole phosphoribosyltransferase [Seleniivibrio woodruffii]TVZ36672.1 nicotinate-nucleotide-dimethylbenzimidazole phosphoribosyltransferase [Seleniivibrio woodruffii]
MNIKDIISNIEPADKEVFRQAQERTANLIMPPRALGRLNDIGEKICSIQRTMKPKVDKRMVFVMAGDHGIVEERVAAFPQEVTGQMMGAFVAGLASINVLSRQAKSKVLVADIGAVCDVNAVPADPDNTFVVKKIRKGTANFTKGAAMTREEAEKCIMAGFEIADEMIKRYDLNLIATGDMGIGNTTPSSAIGAVFTGETAEVMTGFGSGIDNDALKRKIDVIKRGIELNKPDKSDALDVLSKVGGLEIGAIAGVILAGAYHKIPVLVDGIISAAGALIAYGLCPVAVEYMISGHKSVEPGQIKMLQYMGLEPLVDLGLRLGEGTGAVMAMHSVEAGVRVITEISTFAEAGVSTKEM